MCWIVTLDSVLVAVPSVIGQVLRGVCIGIEGVGTEVTGSGPGSRGFYRRVPSAYSSSH